MNIKKFSLVWFIAIIALSGISTFAQDSKIGVDKGSDGPAPGKLAPTPIFFPAGGNFTCANLNASTDPAFAHMTENSEWKFDPPNSTSFAPRTSGLGGGLPSNPNMFMSLTVSPSTTMTTWSLSWSSTAAIDRLVSAVIIKGGNVGTYVYPYPSLSAGDVGPFVLPSNQAISHISFCFEPFSAPTAAPVSVSGRVVSSSGRGISNTYVSVVNLNTGETKTAVTNMFGNYKVMDLNIGDLYTISVMSKRYTFNEPVRTFQIEADLTSMDFVAN